MQNALSRIALAVSACALGVALVRRPPPPPPAAPAPATPAATADDVAALRAELAQLRADQARPREAAPAALAATTAPAATGVDEQRVRDLVREELAQRGGGPGRNQAPPDPAEIKKTLATELGLDDEHAAKVADLVAANRTAIRELFRNGGGGDRAQMREKIDALNADLKTEAAKVLEPEQAAKLDQWLQAQRGRFGRGGAGGQRPPRGDAPAPAQAPGKEF